MSSMVDWALFYHSQGLSIIPVQGKIPLIKWSTYQERRASEEEIKQWWARWPEADIGCITGSISNKLVLDIDGAQGFAATKEMDFGITRVVKTARGKQYHYQWQGPGSYKTTLAGVLPEVDVRGEGGYVKLPPSKFSGGLGRYEWINGLDVPLAECPQWLIELMSSKQRNKLDIRESGESWLKEKLDSIAPDSHNRNAILTSIAGRLRKEGWNEKDMYLLLEPHAERVSFEKAELRTICNSVSGYAPSTRIDLQTEAQSVSDEEIVVPSQVLSQKSKVNWLIDPKLVSVNSLSFIVGLPKACKSWILMDLALALATGTQWMGKFPCKASKVIYLDQERAKDSTIERFNQLIGGRGIDAEILDKNLFIKPQSRTKIDLPHSYSAFDRLLEKFKPDIVLVDSFKKFHSKNELATQDMQAVFTQLDGLRDKHGCSFVFIHHETKGVISKRKEHFEVSYLDAAGTIDLSQSADHFFNVLAYTEKDTSMMYHTANNHGALLEPFKVHVRDVDEAKTKIRVEGR